MASKDGVSPACAANAIRMGVARSLTEPADEYHVCLPDSTPLRIAEDFPSPSSLKDTMLHYAQVLPGGNQTIAVAMQPADTPEWRMMDVKGSAAGGASGSQLFRSANKALWLKTVDNTELGSWRKARDSYNEHFLSSVQDGAPRTFLVRVLGIFVIGEGHCPEQCWLAMLDVVPNVGAGKGGAKPGLTCDVKPHMLSASPQSYASLDACGDMLHSPLQGLDHTTIQNLESARADMCWLSNMHFVDFSWLFARAEEGAAGAVEVKGSWWYIGVIDFLMGYGWGNHGLQGLGRQLENQWKAFKETKELPKGPYSNRVWADPLMYKQGKFEDYSAKQFQVFQSFAACVPSSADDTPVCTGPDAGHDPWMYTNCDPSQVPFDHQTVGLAQKFADERRKQCQKAVVALVEEVYESYARRYQSDLMQASNFAQRSAIRSMIREKSRGRQMQILSELDQKQTQEMAALECVWDSRGRKDCSVGRDGSWISSGCVQLLEEWRG